MVVTGRVTDASVIVGPAAAHFGWARTDYDQLAGAIAAGHVIECGAQATGGNYSFFTEIADLTHPGFPLAEIHADGSSVITKHPGTGGAVTVDTVTAQLLYEITGARYANPDATLRVDTVELSDDGPDRVRISGVKGEPPPPTLKVSLNSIGGFRNEMTLVLTGLDIEAKAELVRRQLETSLTVKPAEMRVDAGAHRPRRRRHRGSRQRAAAMRGPRPGSQPTSDANSLRPQWNSRSPAIRASPCHQPARRRPGVRGVQPGLRARHRGAARRRARRRQPHRHTARRPRPSSWRPFRRSRYRSRCRSATPNACRWD